MKKFSKILLLLLSLAAIITAFTVVVLATAEDETVLSPIVKYDNNFDSYDYGKYLGDNATKVGYFGAHGQEGTTDKYLLHYGKEHSGTSASSFLSGLYSYGTASKDAYGNAVTTTGLADYPYAVFEFDVMKITDYYSTFSVGTYIKGSGVSSPTNFSIKSSSLTSHLPSEQYEWAKATVIFAYHSETVDKVKTGYLSAYAYVNGAQVYSYYKAKSFAYDSDGEYGATFVDGEKTVNGALESELYFTDLRLDTSSTTNTDTTKRSAFDNVKLTVYPAGYTLDELANITYPKGYTFPYTKTRAILNGKGYESVKAAIDAANDGDTVYLREDVEETLIINKAITVVADATKLSDENSDGVDYDATGIIQDETKEAFTFNYVSYTGYVAEQSGSTYSFSLADELAKVDWDCCDGECDCYFKNSVGHILTAETLVPLGGIPAIPVSAPTFNIENGIEIVFKGWSYTEGASEADTLVAITEDDVANGVKLYPVYEITQYAFEIIPTEGESSYYLDSEWETAFKTAPANSTIKFCADVTINSRIYFSGTDYNKSITIDLNGFALSKVTKIVTQYSATLDENGEYVKGDALGDAVTTGDVTGYLFTMSSYNGYTFTLKSSRPGATVANLTVTSDEWVCEKDVVKTEIKSVAAGGGLVSLYPANSTFNIYGENIHFYTRTLFYGEHGGNNSGLSVNVDGGTYYIFPSSGQIFQMYHGGTHSIKNATFFCNGAYIVRATQDKSTNTTFENCDIINSSGPKIAGETETQKFVNCRMAFVEIGRTAGTVIFEDDCIYTADLGANLTVAEGHEIVPVSYSKTYTVKGISVNENYIPDNFTESTTTVTYAYEIANSAADFATVTWNDPDGNLISTSEKVLKSAYAEAAQPSVKLPVGDGLRGYTNPTWLNADGSVADLVLGRVDGNTFTFKASMPAEPDYVAYITDAMFNLSYYGHFGYNLYIPKVEGVTYIQIGDYTSPNYMYNAKIDGVDYIYANAGWIGPANAIKEYTKYVKYEIDGVQYSASFKLNAMLYAELLLSDTVNTAEVEKDAILKMMDYVEEAYKISAENGTLDEETQAKFDNFFASYNSGARPDRITDYPEAEIHTLNSDFTSYVSELGFAIYKNNSRYSLIAKLNADAVAAGYTLKISGMTSAIYPNQDSNKNNVYNDDGSLTYYTNNTGLAGGIMHKNTILTVCDSEGNAVASTSYSLATYIDGVKKQGESTALAEALYSFGKAVIEVRAYLSTL